MLLHVFLRFFYSLEPPVAALFRAFTLPTVR